MFAVEAVQVRKVYGEVVAVAGVDLTLPTGQVAAVLGPNGAGKTTLIEILLGLRRPTAGRVRILGRAPRDRQVRAVVGAMLQDSSTPEGLTVTEVIRLVGRYHPYRLPVDDVLERAGLTAKRGARVGQLSGGQRQRLSFALAISGDPDLLFLDEPTAALDVQSRRAFWRQVRDFAALGKTVLFSTHHLAEADAYADRVLVLHRGRLLHDGSPQQIKALVAGRTMHLVTDAPLDRLRALPGVVAAEITDDAAPPGLHRASLQAERPEVAISALVTAGEHVEDLTVIDTDLETAFVQLTGSPAEVSA